MQVHELNVHFAGEVQVQCEVEIENIVGVAIYISADRIRYIKGLVMISLRTKTFGDI